MRIDTRERPSSKSSNYGLRCSKSSVEVETSLLNQISKPKNRIKVRGSRAAKGPVLGSGRVAFGNELTHVNTTSTPFNNKIELSKNNNSVKITKGYEINHPNTKQSKLEGNAISKNNKITSCRVRKVNIGQKVRKRNLNLNLTSISKKAELGRNNDGIIMSEPNTDFWNIFASLLTFFCSINWLINLLGNMTSLCYVVNVGSFARSEDYIRGLEGLGSQTLTACHLGTVRVTI